MKFTCDRCGKRFSSVDEPMPGRVYRIRCRCGNAIQISSPQLMPEAAPRRKGGAPAREPGADGATPAIPPLHAGPRSATPAGDAGAPVRSAAPAAAPRIAAQAVDASPLDALFTPPPAET
ncbi:MAG TPA: hypothetical protein VFK90_01710, partial [Anaeromyxobacter sp.]|nr:hypothetical protein [Anaeromyxobacter sp.]